MASAKATETTATEVKEAVTEERKFPIATLRGNSVKLFGVTTSTFDGAFYGSQDKELSIANAKEKINKWLGKEIGK